MRTSLPDITSPQLHDEWLEARAVMERLDHLGIPCAMGVETREMLFKTVRAAGCKRVLDIGTFVGSSALTFALAVGEGGHVTTVDIREQNDAADSHWRIRGRPQSPRDLLTAAGVADRVIFVCGDSVTFLERDTAEYDFISIDGWHHPDGVYEDVRLSFPRLAPDGLLFLDDMQPPGFVPHPGMDVIRGPWDAVQRHLTEGLQVNIVPPLPNVAVAFLVPR